MCMCIIVCGVDVIIFNAIERYVSCVMVIRVGPRSMAVDGCMLVPVCIVFVFRICVYECVYDVVCLYIGVLMCMHMSAYVCVCEHMCLLICMWWCRFGVDDGFGIMVLSGCSPYVTEPVDVVLVVTGRVLYVVGGPLHVCTVLWWWLCWGHHL